MSICAFAFTNVNASDARELHREAKMLIQKQVHARKHFGARERSAVPKLGVTCPPFFRCEAPRLSQLAILPRQRIPQTDHFRRLPAAAKQTLNRLPIIMVKQEADTIVPRAKIDADLFFFVEPRRAEEIAAFP